MIDASLKSYRTFHTQSGSAQSILPTRAKVKVAKIGFITQSLMCRKIRVLAKSSSFRSIAVRGFLDLCESEHPQLTPGGEHA